MADVSTLLTFRAPVVRNGGVREVDRGRLLTLVRERHFSVIHSIGVSGCEFAYQGKQSKNGVLEVNERGHRYQLLLSPIVICSPDPPNEVVLFVKGTTVSIF
jgi:hypothetical protein